MRRTTSLDAGIRREIIAALTDDRTLSTATAIVAQGWSRRREHHGESPASVLVASAMVFQVGAEMAGELVAA